MKKYIQYALVSMLGVLMWACSSDETGDGVQTRDGKVVLAKAVTFHVNFAGYNATQEVGTRATAANNMVEQKATVLDNGIVAVTMLQRDTTQQAPAAKTRALDNGTYTMLAYQGGVFKGEVKGHISGGTFAYADNNAMELQPGTYDFVLINDKVTRTGDKITVKKDDMEQGLIGRTTYTVTAAPQHQQVTFEMHPTAVRLKVRLLGYMNFTLSGSDVGKLSVDAPGQAPTKVEYDMANNTWATVATSTDGYPKTLTFPTATQDGVTYSSTCTDYVYYLPGAQVNQHLQVGNLSIYDRATTYSYWDIKQKMVASVEPGTSYLLTIKFMMPAYYLMSDGTVGKTSETTAAGGTKTPIGVVLSRSKHLAIALEDAGKGAKFKWYKEATVQVMANSAINLGMQPSDYVLMSSDDDGYHYTWEDCGFGFDVPTRKGDNKTDFPAFYAAGHYGDELAAKVTLTNGMENKKWYLPAVGELCYVYSVLGKGNVNHLIFSGQSYAYNDKLVTSVFTQVGGKTMVEAPSLTAGYWGSSECSAPYLSTSNYPYGGYVQFLGELNYFYMEKEKDYKVRACVKY